MFKRAFTITLHGAILVLTATGLLAQGTGLITGTVADQSGAMVPGAPITITNKTTGAIRNVSASAEGLYSAPSLPAGDYEVRAEVQGFRTLVRPATVDAGSSTTVNLALSIGAASEIVTVEGATAQINYESHTVAGVIARESIQDLPLNGRNLLQLATLEPGITSAPASVGDGVMTVAGCRQSDNMASKPPQASTSSSGCGATTTTRAHDWVSSVKSISGNNDKPCQRCQSASKVPPPSITGFKPCGAGLQVTASRAERCPALWVRLMELGLSKPKDHAWPQPRTRPSFASPGPRHFVE